MLDSLMSFFSAEENSQQIDTHWMSESGIIDVFVMLGPKPHDVFQQYAALTGTATLPPVIIFVFCWRIHQNKPFHLEDCPRLILKINSYCGHMIPM